ncbi:MAG: hypothetical protein PHE84_14485 [bacterium]|nr:hypothetical protein [bacterium]
MKLEGRPTDWVKSRDAMAVRYKYLFPGCHSGLDPESRFFSWIPFIFWIPAFAGMTADKYIKEEKKVSNEVRVNK